MRFEEQTTVGGDPGLVPDRSAGMRSKVLLVALVLLLGTGGLSSAQSMYKYRGPDGEWI